MKNESSSSSYVNAAPMSERELAQFFPGDSELAARMRDLDWSQTPLGTVETWPQSLRSALSICLNSRFPIAIYWGQHCLLLYKALQQNTCEILQDRPQRCILSSNF